LKLCVRNYENKKIKLNVKFSKSPSPEDKPLSSKEKGDENAPEIEGI
jgi:hypothetical protein